MLTSLPTLSLLFAAGAQAFRSTSPFFVLSTEPLRESALSSTQLATADDVLRQLVSALSPSDATVYIVASQPGITAADLKDGEAMPRMKKRVLSDAYKDVVQIPEVIGDASADAMVEALENMYGITRGSLEGYQDHVLAHPNKRFVAELQLPVLHPGEEARKHGLEAADIRIEEYLAPISNTTKHVFIYLSTPPDSAHFAAEQAESYEMDEPISGEAMHTDLKRAVDSKSRSRRASSEHQAGLPLFERYQFLSPGIFMGLSVTLLLFLILYVGVSAIAGLEVSYMAFSKEMGPQSQNKGKQQ